MSDTYPQPQAPRARPPAKQAKPKPASLWADITKDHKTGHYVYKDWAKAVSFMLGVGLVLFSAYADFRAKREINPWGATALLTYALGTAYLKVDELQQNRKTADDNGNPLAVPGTTEPPASPEIMPQANGTTSA